MTSADCLKYLKRIKYTGSIRNSVEVLTKLQQLHLSNVPFENLDIHTGKRIELKNSYDKIVNKHRGGFCYELNGLFFQLLIAIGFEAKLISARAYNSKLQTFGPEFDHMAIVASIENQNYLVDVGFGEFTYSPLKLELDLLQVDRTGKFMIKQYDNTYLSASKLDGEEFMPEYIFTKTHREPSDFTEMCNYHQTSSLSHFTQKRVCSMVTEKGRITISGNVLKRTENGKVTEISLTGEAEFNKALWDYFSVKL